MLLALVLGVTLGIAGRTLVRQWLDGVLTAEVPAPTSALTPAEFPRLAPPTRRPAARRMPRAAAPRPAASFRPAA